MPKLSVIMASYNHAAFVREAIDSVLSQSYRDLELVITDDGSNDGTADVVRGVVDMRIRFHALAENQGACVAINDAITRAQGEYIAVLNSDDYFLPGKLQRQVDFLDANPEIGAVFGLPRFIDETGSPLSGSNHAFGRLFSDQNRSRQDWLKSFFYGEKSLCHPTVMLRRACYDAVGLFDPLLMQLPDLDMWVRLCGKFEIKILSEQLTAFRVLDRERNVSAPSAEKMARHAWEMTAILGRFAVLSEKDLCQIFEKNISGDSRHCAHVTLALEAIRLERPGYTQFGLTLLRDCLRRDNRSFSIIEYFKLVGDIDPFAVRFSGKEHRFLAKSRLWAVLKGYVQWIRAI